jgi:hypothetical protein
MVPEGTPVALGANRKRVAEVEFVFSVAHTPPYANDEVKASVEIPDSRYRFRRRGGLRSSLPARISSSGREVAAA